MRIFIATILLLSLFIPLEAQTIEGGRTNMAVENFHSGLQAERKGETSAAIEFYLKAAEDPAFSLRDYACFAAANLYYKDKLFPNAIEQYQTLTANYPKSLLLSKGALQLGKSFYHNKNYQTAVKTFSALLEKYPELEEADEARYLIALSHEKNGDWKGAYFAYEETDLYHPLSRYGHLSRLAISKLKKKYKKKLPQYQASEKALFNQGMAYFNQEEYKMAANIFNRLARTYPKSSYLNEAWIMLGRAETLDDDYDQGIANLEKAARNAPNLAGKANYYLGRAYGRRGKYDWAVTALGRVIGKAPASDLAPEALYWRGYFRELLGDTNHALEDYYSLVKNYPNSSTASSAIWRMGKVYYWASDWQNAVNYFHLAQLYPMGSETPRCYFFEAKSLERQGNTGAALEVYKKLAKRFDHTYYAYRAQERLRLTGNAISDQVALKFDNIGEVLKTINEKDNEELSTLMDIWLQSKSEKTTLDPADLALHLSKYQELMDLGLTSFAAEEAKFLVNGSADTDKESAQLKLGEVLVRAGRYISAIRFAQQKIDSALYSDKVDALPEKVWQLAYPRGYWKTVRAESNNYGVDPYLVLAVIREESRFLNNARSHASARGLMQIMPGTGLGLAKELKLSRYRTSKLYDTDINIKMGSYYLANLIKSFNNNVYLSLAGYNGGPNRVWRY
ncbi:MAG: tetratricopeptide repeat protein, partial [Candidatus Margulisbacteria bacterium]|nr:tetratricopeptide repeat protein [Candidatus Margulisiibacteriota bacterium]